MGNNFGRIDAKKHRCEVFNVEKINNLSILDGTATFPHNPSLISEGAMHEAYSQNIRRAAFTLAEVLITLGIIGVVAAMTMPTLIMQHQKKVFATRVKQTYSIISNALLSSVADNGAPNTWNFGDSVDTDGINIINDPEAIKRLAKTYFAPYLKVIKEGTGQSSGYYLMLSNGSTLTFWTDGAIDADDIYTPSALYIIVSFNGNTNVYWNESRDYSRNDVIMTVNVKNDYAKLSFFNWYSGEKNRDSIKNHYKYGCNKDIPKHQRMNCGALLQMDGWEIKDDYPWR